MHHRRPRPRLALLAGLLLALAVPAAALAHPLGNFTINHYSGIRVSPERIVIDQVFDLAEIPALQALQPTGGDFGPAGPTAFAAGDCRDLASDLTLTVDGVRLDLALSAAGRQPAAGPGRPADPARGLHVCRHSADSGHVPMTPITFHDDTYAQRIGWREIVVEGDGVTIDGAGVTSQDISRTPDALSDRPPGSAARPVRGQLHGGSRRIAAAVIGRA